MYHELKHHLPRIGLRIAKSSFAAGVCVFIYYLLGFDRLPFFIVLAAIQCMENYSRDIKTVVTDNISGLFIGAVCALVIIWLQYMLPVETGLNSVWNAIFIALGVGVSLYTAVVLNMGSSAQFAAVIFLCIVGVHVENESPFIYVAQRLVETLVGVGIGTAVNIIHLPRKKDTDTLFAVSLDEVLRSEISHLPDYSKVEFNRILDEGINLTMMTRHSAASLRESGAGIKFRLPVILMDGAAIYDPNDDRYIDTVVIDHHEAIGLQTSLQALDLSVYISTVINNSLIIFYEHILPDSREMFERLRRSPYRNYIHRSLPDGINAVNLTAIGSKEKIDAAYNELIRHEVHNRYKILRYDFEEKCPYAYMRILSKDADRQTSLEKLKELTGFENCLSFGSDADLYDICVKAQEGESILKALRRYAEPVKFFKRK